MLLHVNFLLWIAYIQNTSSRARATDAQTPRMDVCGPEWVRSVNNELILLMIFQFVEPAIIDKL